MASNKQIAELLRQTNPKSYAAMVLGVAQAAVDETSRKVSYLESMLQHAREQHEAAKLEASEAGSVYDSVHDDSFLPTDRPLTLGEQFHARKNGIPQTDKQSNYGQY